MSKPFRLGSDAGKEPVREQFVPPAPPKIVREAAEQGKTVQRVIAENRAPEHPTPKGQPKSADELPWPAVDEGRKPMRLD